MKKLEKLLNVCFLAAILVIIFGVTKACAQTATKTPPPYITENRFTHQLELTVPSFPEETSAWESGEEAYKIDEITATYFIPYGKEITTWKQIGRSAPKLISRVKESLPAINSEHRVNIAKN
jgi:hypothetical protein